MFNLFGRMKNISEPVLTLGRIFREEHERFDINQECAVGILLTIVTDKRTEKSFTVYESYGTGSTPVVLSSWMTPEEGAWLAEAVVSTLQQKAQEKREQQRKENERYRAVEDQKERAEWLDAYKDDM